MSHLIDGLINSVARQGLIWQERVQGLIEKIEDLKKKNEDLIQENQYRSDLITKLFADSFAQNEQARDKFLELQGNLQQFQSRYSILLEEQHQQQAELTRLQAERQIINNTCHQQQAELTRLQAERQVINNTYHQQQAELTSLQAERQIINNTYHQQQAELTRLKAENQNLQEAREQLQNKYEQNCQYTNTLFNLHIMGVEKIQELKQQLAIVQMKLATIANLSSTSPPPPENDDTDYPGASFLA